MKQRFYIIRYFYCLAILALLLSCDKENELNLENAERLTIKNIWGSQDYPYNSKLRFVFLSNQDGEILYKESGRQLKPIIELNVSGNDVIDLTYYAENEDYFSIYTYRNIKSSFQIGYTSIISPEQKYCSNEFNLKESSEKKRLELTIDGISDYSELYVSFINSYTESELIKKNSLNNTITVKSRRSENVNNDYLVIIKPINDSSYFSMRLQSDDWDEEDDFMLIKSIDFNDFLPIKPTLIKVDKKGVWSARSKIKTSGSKIIKLPYWRSNSPPPDFPQTDEIELFIPSDISVDQISLSAFSSFPDLHSIIGIFEEIPEDIILFDPDIDLENVEKSGYFIPTFENFSIAIADYQYKGFPGQNTWEVVQVMNKELNYSLPNLPAEYVNQSEKLKELLNNPTSFTFQISQGNLDIPYEGTSSLRAMESCPNSNLKYFVKQF